MTQETTELILPSRIEAIAEAAAKADEVAGRLQLSEDAAFGLDMAVRENVKRVVTRLRSASDPILMDPLKAGKLKIVGARYDLDDGSVDFFMEG